MGMGISLDHTSSGGMAHVSKRIRIVACYLHGRETGAHQLESYLAFTKSRTTRIRVMGEMRHLGRASESDCSKETGTLLAQRKLGSVQNVSFRGACKLYALPEGSQASHTHILPRHCSTFFTVHGAVLVVACQSGTAKGQINGGLGQ